MSVLIKSVKDSDKKHRITLAVLAVYLIVNTTLLATGALGYIGFIKAEIFIMALLACVILPVHNWQAPMRSKLSPIASLLFILGALITLRTLIGFYQEWTEGWVGALSDEVQNALMDPMKQEVPTSIRTPLELAYSMLLAPVGEEFVYRFCLLGSLSAFVRKPWALIISTLVFVFGHYWGHNIIALGEVTLLGFTLGLTYMTCGLGWAMLLHGIFNSFWTIQNSETMEFLFVIIMPFSLWIFFTRLFRLRKVVFGADS
jgi:membrane protease YdiL (CAAX protease family)